MMKQKNPFVRWAKSGAAVLGAIAVLLPATAALSADAVHPDHVKNRAFIQEGLGLAIVSAATAETDREKARSQEVLGSLIVQAALADHPVRMIPNGPSNPVQVSGHEPVRGYETQGEPIFWVLAAFGGTAMLIFAFFGLRTGPMPRG